MVLTTSLYGDASVSGPTYCESSGRWHVCVWLKDEQRSINLTLARFRYQEHIGRILSTEEEVDHIDDNKLNDELTNLQLLTKGENVAKRQTKYHTDKVETCHWCDKAFTLTPKQQRQRYMNRKRTVGAFCSRSCAGAFGRSQK